MKCFENRAFVVVFGSFGHCAGGFVLDCLQAVYLRRVDVAEKIITVVKFEKNYRGGILRRSCNQILDQVLRRRLAMSFGLILIVVRHKTCFW